MEYLPAMRSFLQQPYPFSENAGRKLVVCSGVGLFITFFLVVFAPYGLDELPAGQKWLHALAFGAVTFVVASLVQIVAPKLFPTLFREEGWRTWKEIVYLLFTTAVVGAANYVLMLRLYPQKTEMASFLQAELITLQVGIFPVCFLVFLKQMLLYRRFATEASAVTTDIREEEQPVIAGQALSVPAIVLRGDNQKEEVSVQPQNLLYLSAADNYVTVHFLESGKPATQLLRGSLKKMEEQLAGQSAFFRCHRTYIVNLQQVHTVSGNAQGLKLHLDGQEEPIPVSRSLTDVVKEKLHQLSHSPQKA
ncbi:LytTR family transcriptional regulator [Flavisolibacter sp. BT320]|nr:LytTR family transcriptional regulator [Flavisolibacter longurius]